jgi:hypothetical protein
MTGMKEIYKVKHIGKNKLCTRSQTKNKKDRRFPGKLKFKKKLRLIIKKNKRERERERERERYHPTNRAQIRIFVSLSQQHKNCIWTENHGTICRQIERRSTS